MADASKPRLSRHAEEALARRQIPRDWLDRTLDAPEQRIAQSAGMEILQPSMNAPDGKMFLVRAVVATDRETPVVVSVYRTTKAEKYWRSE